eukprot:81723-Pyramimonas_sp.AAC.1
MQGRCPYRASRMARGHFKRSDRIEGDVSSEISSRMSQANASIASGFSSETNKSVEDVSSETSNSPRISHAK